MITIELTEAEVNDLKVFLQRANMSGAEVPAYVAIINRIHEAEVNAKPKN